MNTINWQQIPWKEHYRNVAKIQESIVMAYKTKKYKLLYERQRQLLVSLSARSLAVRRLVANLENRHFHNEIVNNLDNKSWDKPAKRVLLLELLRQVIENPKAYPLGQPRKDLHKGVFADKGVRNKGFCRDTLQKPPLTTFSTMDKLLQILYHMALDPVVESQSDANSYGFRFYRSPEDALRRLRDLLDKKTSPHWVWCVNLNFQKVNFSYIMEKTMICDKTFLEKWLNDGILQDNLHVNHDKTTTSLGTMQGTLCNIVLNGLERAARERVTKPPRGKQNKVHLTRYGNSFVCTAASQHLLGGVREGVEQFLSLRNLSLENSESKVVNLSEGFDFLGWNFQRKAHDYRYNLTRVKTMTTSESVLIIKPNTPVIRQLRHRIRTLTLPQRPMESIIKNLNPILREFSAYFRTSYHSLPVFWSLGHFLWRRMWLWARKKHPRRRAQWVFDRYVMSKSRDRKWVFGKSERETLFDLSKVTSIKKVPLKQGLNPYLPENRDYYEKRTRIEINAPFRKIVYQKHNHQCSHCGQSLHNGESVELHHIIPQTSGGDWSLANILPLHTTCHKAVTHDLNT